MKDEGRRMKGCPARQISGVNFGRGKIHALLSLFAITIKDLSLCLFSFVFFRTPRTIRSPQPAGLACLASLMPLNNLDGVEPSV